MQRSLVLLKPDAVVIRESGIEALKRFQHDIEQCTFLVFQHVNVPKELGEQHYAEHKGKKFFPALINMITNPNGVYIIVVEGIDAISKIRASLGPTMVENAMAQDCLRGKFGTVGGINCCHASDGIESAKREVGLWTGFFKIELNEEVAKKNIEAFKATYEGKFCADLTKIREIVNRIKVESNEYVNEMKKLTDADDYLIRELLATIIVN